ncbi:MAG: hypothetical protein WCC17_00730 [Candidatus Nitrosopolaris sp.]
MAFIFAIHDYTAILATKFKRLNNMINTFELDIKLGPRNHQVIPAVITSIFIICLWVTPTVNATSISDLKQARIAYDNGDYSAALYYLHQILKTKPTIQILTDIGSTLNELGNYSGVSYHLTS